MTNLAIFYRLMLSLCCPYCTASEAGPGKTLCALCNECEGTGRARE